MKPLVPLALSLALALSGCAAHRVEVPAAVPKSAPAKPKSEPAGSAPVASPGQEHPRAEPGGTAAAPAPAPTIPSAARPQGNAPPATESAYVYAPQQAATASPAAAGASGAVPAPSSTGGDAVPKDKGAPSDSKDAPPSAPGELRLTVVASAAEIAAGAIVAVDVMASSNTAVVDAPLHLTFDPTVVEFVDGTVGDFLAQGGSSVVFFADGRSRPGDVAVAAGRVERAAGATGSGLLCRVRLRGTGAGTTSVAVGRAKAWGVRGEELAVSSGGASVVVR